MNAGEESIAVVGLACHYPGAPDIRTFWENILARRREFRRTPDARLPVAEYYDADPLVPDKTCNDKCALIDGFEFDWVKRRIPKSTVESSDIVHWLALEIALAAWDDAGLSKDTVSKERTGVILGNTLTGEQTRAQTLSASVAFCPPSHACCSRSPWAATAGDRGPRRDNGSLLQIRLRAGH